GRRQRRRPHGAHARRPNCGRPPGRRGGRSPEAPDGVRNADSRGLVVTGVALKRVAATRPPRGVGERTLAIRATLVIALAAAAAILAVVLAGGTRHVGTAVLEAVTVGAWTFSGALVTVRRPDERSWRLILEGTLIGAVALLATAVMWAGGGRA